MVSSGEIFRDIATELEGGGGLWGLNCINNIAEFSNTILDGIIIILLTMDGTILFDCKHTIS